MTSEKVPAGEDSGVKYPHPKVLLVDVDQRAGVALIGGGFAVRVGSFGRPLEFARTPRDVPVPLNGSLPNYAEQEVIIVDLTTPPSVSFPSSEQRLVAGQFAWWLPGSNGLADPRPLAMARATESSDRILANGGVFVVFSAPRSVIHYVAATANHWGGPVLEKEFLPCDNWSFLSCLASDHVTVDRQGGFEMFPGDDKYSLFQLVARHLRGGQFRCVFTGLHPHNEWMVLARNKYGDAVAAVRVLEGKGGMVLLLPQIKDKTAFLLSLLRDVLPELAPHLFPDAEGAGWVHAPEYELPAVVGLEDQIAQVEEKTRKQVSALRAEIERERQENAYLYDLIRGTGRPLVLAVMKALSVLGVKDVRDVDEEAKKAGEDAALREDLQVHDRSPVLVADVKGVGGRPSDEEALQAQKHANIRMHEWRRLDVQGLTIINHERHLPPLDRENRMPFREEILKAAQMPPTGLMTTWDLWKLVRSYAKNGWRPEHVQPVFYRTGRVDVRPEHYQFLGTVVEVYGRPFGVTLQDGPLRRGDRVAVETRLGFEEAVVESLRVHDQAVEEANAGDDAGIVAPFGKGVVRKGARVFLVRQG
jgi:hypothetical protein